MKTRLACSLPAFETQELAAAVEAWCEILCAAVPVDRLNDAYLLAMRTRTSIFPLAATEIIEASRRIAADLESKRRPPCSLCYGKGTAWVFDPVKGEDFLKECPSCFGKVVTSLETTA